MMTAFHRTCPPRLFARLLAAFGLAAVLLAGAPASRLAAQSLSPEQQQVRERLEGQRAVVDSVEAGLGRESLRSAELDELRARLDPVRGALDAAIGVLEPRLEDMRNRVKEIGPAPADGNATEEASITQERDQLNARAAELDGLLKQGRLLKVRADQAADRIISRRRALFTDTLLERSYSVLDPELWFSAARAIPIELRGISYLLSDWRTYADARMARSGQIAVLFGIGAIIALVVLLKRMVERPLRHFEAEPADTPVTPLRAATLSGLVAVSRAVAAPAATLACLALADAFSLIPPRAADIASGLTFAITLATVGRAFADAALAPNAPRRRVPPLSDAIAQLVYRAVATLVIMMAGTAFLNNMHRTLVAPVSLTVATSALFGLVFVVVTGRALRAIGREADEESETSAPDAALQWLRLPIWLLLAVVVGALLSGYVSLSVFLASRALVALVLAGALYLIVALINGYFIDSFDPHARRTRHIAATLGVRPASLGLIGVLVSGFLKLLAIIVATVMVVGTWGTSTADLRDFVSRISFALTIGTSTISLADVMSAVVLLVVGLIIARAVQRWFAANVLPRSGLEASLQNSISTILGYVGFVAVTAIAMGRLGLNLENVALVAGALSVGIGFGLQSIVSNFVSGLILLAERPIRVGDTILVKGEEGYVRRISVRATEIETYDRAMVLIPNSELITGMVKNFTHANTTGRVIVAVSIAYDADLDAVRDILIGCACDHPQVVQSPPPRVFLVKFGESALHFELRCVVANVDYSLTVKSDLHFSVLEQLRNAHIGVPVQPWSIYRGPTATPAAGA
ncbi:MAG TPA: DUF3772 domain-containing protein [Xanthobacteraceae bacterium]|nr:DUF3772 domain-containing protein [Xanthobacteraceae bacterium]